MGTSDWSSHPAPAFLPGRCRQAGGRSTTRCCRDGGNSAARQAVPWRWRWSRDSAWHHQAGRRSAALLMVASGAPRFDLSSSRPARRGPRRRQASAQRFGSPCPAPGPHERLVLSLRAGVVIGSTVRSGPAGPEGGRRPPSGRPLEAVENLHSKLTSTPSPATRVTCCIAGCGPAGAMLVLLLTWRDRAGAVHQVRARLTSARPRASAHRGLSGRTPWAARPARTRRPAGPSARRSPGRGRGRPWAPGRRARPAARPRPSSCRRDRPARRRQPGHAAIIRLRPAPPRRPS
jgi:hypothetical protein